MLTDFGIICSSIVYCEKIDIAHAEAKYTLKRHY